jgi:hypothetical protein
VRPRERLDFVVCRAIKASSLSALFALSALSADLI